MKNIIFDVLLLILILTAFFAGFFMGEKKQYDKSYDFYDNYINKECECKGKIEIKDNKIWYEYNTTPDLNFTDLFSSFPHD